MTAVAIVSVGVSGTVAVAAILVGLWQQQRLFDHERGIADREAVRGILADAAKVVNQADHAISDAFFSLEKWGYAMFENEEREKPYATLRDTGTGLDGVFAQVKIALGPEHSATLALGQAGAAYHDAYRALDMIRIDDPDDDMHDAEEFAEMVDRQRERYVKAQGNFQVALEQFFEQAHAAAGAQLPPSADEQGI